ncbi:MAG: glycosyltransferase [Cutibacterium avidum]|nr:glycosyltransferase [Propionibacterium sp.]MDU3218740.1 glycosyltransferase [Cutibacterium avidum]MDU3726619.1 glycosyltransferase [Cutibacterium avidum]MDU4207105.1 glycosyltransferase [Cutibacterium avidum]MDU4675661.1 glycosyltransferase [Cutibacterium avidum]
MTTFTIASNQGSMGGGEVMMLAIAEAARELGREVTVVAPQTPGDVVEEALRRGFRVMAIHGDTTAKYLASLRRWDATERRGLLWCNGLRPAFATSGHLNRVVHLHQRPAGKLRALAVAARRGALATVVPSAYMAAAVPGSRVMWNWNPPARTRDFTEPGATVTVGFLGRLSSDKGVPRLCETMSELERRHPGRFRLLLAGESRFVDPADAQLVARRIASLGDLVDHRGWMDRDEFFSSVDLAVFPSVWPETFGLVVSEAMSAHCPFVITDAGALQEVAGAEHPFVAKADDAVSLADTIERAAEGYDEELLDAARDRWQTNFSPGAGRARLAEILADVDPEPSSGAPRVAIAHDYLTQRGGAERVVSQFATMFPEASIVTSVYEPDLTYPDFASHEVITSPLNRIGWLRRHFRAGLPLYDWAFDHTEVPAGTDTVLVSTTGFAHGVKTPPGCRKVVYCHSPARFLYLADDYLGDKWWRSPKGIVLRALTPPLRRWDQKAAASADEYLCNSTVVRDRIRDVYGIEATVVHPPYSLDPDGPQEPLPGSENLPSFFLTVSRLMPYKNVDVLLHAFADMPDEHLVVIGSGPLRDELHDLAPANVSFFEGISDAQLRWAYAHAAAVIAPSKEDFGLTPVEGFAFGTPCLALHAGGYLDTVVDGISGQFFDSATPDAVVQAVRSFRENPVEKRAVLDHAERFSPDTFSKDVRHAMKAST